MKTYLHGLNGSRRIDNTEIARLYLEDGLDGDAVGLIAGCSSTTVHTIVRASGGAVRGRAGRQPDYRRRLTDAEITQRYRLGFSGYELAEQAACSTATIYDILKRAGVDRRSPGPSDRDRPKALTLLREKGLG